MNRRCPQCGARVELPPERLADRCAFCETPLVAAGGDGEPTDLVVPFVLGRERAARALAARLSTEWLAPEAVRRATRPEQIHGVLVPFYVYDGVARSRFHAQVGLATKDAPDPDVAADYAWFRLSGTHASASVRQLASGSRGLPEAEANALEPFDLGRALPYRPELTAGWIAERPDVGHTEAAATVAREFAARENAAIRERFLPGDRHEEVGNDTEVELSAVQLALLPVWIATVRDQGRAIRLLVNGQTGEVVGTVPRSRWKIVGLWMVGLSLVGSVVACAGVTAALIVGFR